MRFFKYLVLIFASIISVDAFAAYLYRSNDYPSVTGGSLSEICSNIKSYIANPNRIYTSSSSRTDSESATSFTCFFDAKTLDGQSLGLYQFSGSKSNACPAKGSLKVFYYPAGSTSVPTRTCVDGCTYEGGHAIDTPNHVAITMQATGDGKNCTNESGPKPPPTCDKTDPYGGCYVPPNDNCMRLADGSIHCPDNEKPPENNTCNGADYCKRPPEGCGSGYVPGSFNGQQLCVRSGPNVPKEPPEPDNPQDPQNCMNGGSYCPQPPDNTKCPAGYYETTYNGSKICVKDNPDPEKPNPNDPTGGKGPDGGDGGGDGSTGGGSIDVKGIIDAINSLKAALLNALSGISAKLDKLINGQTETNKKLDTSNDHLKNIKDESVKTNQKLDTSNGHLEKIEEATKATSEAVGESNKKLDGVKDAVEGMYKCKNEAYNPNDKSSSKYRECTEQDAKNAFGEEPKMPFKDLDLGSINTGLFKITGQCPAPYQLYLPVVNHTFDVDISKLCDVLAIIGYFIALAAMIHGIAILVENS